MVLQGILIVICIVLMVYLSKHLYVLNSRRREDARAERMRNAVDWTKPPSRRKQRSRISDFLRI
jgi:hypothetical protein